MPLPFPSLSLAAHTPSPEHHRRPLPPLRRPPVHHGQLTPALAAPLQTPRELPLTPLTLPCHSSRPDSHRNHLTVATSSLVSFCSRRTHPSAPSPTNPTTPVAFSPPAAATGPELGRLPHRETPRRRAPLRRRFGPPWEPHLRSSLPLPKTSRRRALSS
jgi:hypothetical protein